MINVLAVPAFERTAERMSRIRLIMEQTLEGDIDSILHPGTFSGSVVERAAILLAAHTFDYSQSEHTSLVTFYENSDDNSRPILQCWVAYHEEVDMSLPANSAYQAMIVSTRDVFMMNKFRTWCTEDLTGTEIQRNLRTISRGAAIESLASGWDD
jgi:hypothetical protein